MTQFKKKNIKHSENIVERKWINISEDMIEVSSLSTDLEKSLSYEIEPHNLTFWPVANLTEQR